MLYIYILNILFLNFIYSQDNNEYLIVTVSKYADIANIISDIHSHDVSEEFQLTTKIIFLDDFAWYDIDDAQLNTYIREEILSQEIPPKYLLLLGNETDIPPLYIIASDGTMQPSDDFYSCNENITTYMNLDDSVPQIATGRIPLNSIEQGISVAEKLKDYMVSPTYGLWRSKIGLIADDENKNGYSRNELNHTINSNNIYTNISNNLNVSQFYGINYESIENSTYITKPQMTSDVIDFINQGAGLINYIGHGSETTLGGEKIIDMDRDLNHICDTGTLCKEEQKPAIWVVGTCSFGKYDQEDEIMSEKLLFSEFGAISLITTSRGIGAYANNIYLTNLFNNINEFVLNNNNYRIGDLVQSSKRVGKKTEYLFHLLGDPALILPFPKLITENIVNSENILEDGLEIMKNINNDLYENGISSSEYKDVNLVLLSEEINTEQSYPDTTISYTLKGNQIHAGLISENSCINIPLDIESCADCSTIDLTLFSDKRNNETMYNGSIQIIKNIPVYQNDQFTNDNTGPLISLSQGGVTINNNSIVNKDLPIEINIQDPQGINLMEEFQHNIRYWFNDSNYIYNLNSNLFEYDSDLCGKISAIFSLPTNLVSGNNTINIEAWDNGNNRTLLEYSFIIETNKDAYVNYLYNFPNPFAKNTFFTFYLSEYKEPSDIEINIYTVQGEKIKTIKASCGDYYNVLEWDGKTDTGRELSNGAYIYSFKSNTTIDGVNYKYQSLNKIAKLK